jgi:uncharacterized protein with PIN domain
VKIENLGDLVYWTYYMIDWKKVDQTPSEQRCVQCGGKMHKVEPVADPKGRSYDGFVCHNCKRVIWVRAGKST